MFDKKQPVLTVAVLACLSLALLLPAAGLAQDADVYLEKMLAMYGSPFKADYTMKMQMNQGGMSMEMNGKGDLTWADETHMLSNMELTMKIPGMDQEMTMSTLTISDGANTWMEMNNPMTGKQVMKMDIAKAQSLAEEQGMSSNASMSPFEQLRTMKEYFTFSVEEKSGGKVTLAGVMNDDVPEQMKAAGPMVQGMRLVLNESTGRLESFSMGPAGEPMLTMLMTSYETVKRSSLPSSLFSYTPPEGVTVMDPLAMQGLQPKP